MLFWYIFQVIKSSISIWKKSIYIDVKFILKANWIQKSLTMLNLVNFFLIRWTSRMNELQLTYWLLGHMNAVLINHFNRLSSMLLFFWENEPTNFLTILYLHNTSNDIHHYQVFNYSSIKVQVENANALIWKNLRENQ